MGKKFLYLFLFISQFIKADDLKLLLIDTRGSDFYNYRNLKILADSVGFKTDFLKFYDLNGTDLYSYNAIFILLDESLIKNQDKFFVKNFIEKIKIFSTMGNKLLGLIFPGSTRCSNQSIKEYLSFLKQFNIVNYSLSNSLRAPLKLVLRSDALKSCAYDTVLLNKRECNSFIFEDKELKDLDLLNKSSLKFAFLPIKNNFSSILHNVYPIGFYIKNKKQNFFISKLSILSFSDIEENFCLNPINFKLREEILSAIQESFNELKYFLLGDKFKNILKKSKLILPKELKFNHLLAETKKIRQNVAVEVVKDIYGWILRDKISCGWLSIDDYDKEKKIQREVELISKAGLNMLWMQIRPEVYFGENGILKEKKQLLLNNINRFTKALKNQYKKLDMNLPKIFIGVELTGNFHKKKVPHALVDLYGKIYGKIPSPLDFKGFWEPELLKPLNEFLIKWEDISNEIAISGIFIDFEMYHAQDQLASYSNLIDFSDLAWNVYAKTALEKISDLPIDERVKYLMDNYKLEEYFATLKKEVKRIGEKIKDFLKSRLPSSIIAVYYPVLPNSWFYQGILEALGSSDSPLILATFNNDFYSHYRWLREKNIYAFHIPVLLLSKLRELNDFKLIPLLRRLNDGIWYNRFSWLKYGYNSNPKFWAKLEQTALNSDLVVKEIKKYS